MRVHARPGLHPAFRGRAEGFSFWAQCLSTGEVAALAARHAVSAGTTQTWELERAPDGMLLVRRWTPSELTLRMEDGRELTLPRADCVARHRVPGPWTVTFPPNRGAPPAAKFEHLIDWSRHPDPGIRHFSGTATYTAELDVSPEAVGPGRELWLDLGRVEVIASVRLDGRELGTLWAPPFRLRLDPPPAPGHHRLEVRVTNLWINRLIGDAALPDNDVKWVPSRANERVPAEWPDWLLRGAPRPSGRVVFSTRGGVYSAGDPLAPSGLLGPVELRVVVVENVR